MAFDIRISVDRETGARWLRAVQNLRRMYIVPLIATSAIPGLPKPPRAIAVTGERLLLDIGRAASRPEATDDPARLFGVFRYALSLSGAHSTLTLAADYHGLDTHKKKVLSDDFGCGMAFVVASELFGATDLLDFETAVAQQLVSTKAPRSRRPDYLGFVGPQRVIILEAKGTQTGSGYSRLRQVPSGCDQVRRVRLVPPGALQVDSRLVVATALYFEDWSPDTVVYIGDPEEARPEDYLLRDDARLDSTRLHYLRIAALIGDLSLASALGGRTVAVEDTTMFSREIDGVRYEGSQILIQSAEALIGVFVGLESALRREVLEHHRRSVDRRPHRQVGAEGIFDDFPAHQVDQEDLLAQRETLAAAEDGTVWVTRIER